ncbi:MAG TPA: tetraacyldisaccharide 4'-kinase [Terracidiphilus sp.]|nr:tetraacyldisaccharide 4'-kinase [Terracidiphilus sp.]
MTRAARPWLRPLVPAYRLALALREFQLRAGLKPVRRLRRPVVSVGNLSAGGAGKTPLVIALAKALSARGVQVDVLSRGYRRRSAVPLLVDPGGTAEEFGDEPLVIARQARVPVFVAAERFEAGLLAERDAPAGADQRLSESASPRLGVHLLDDGFQHRQLHRDLDVLLLSSEDLSDRLLPAGNLREPLHAAQRATVIAIPAGEPEVADWVKSRGWKAQVWRVRRRMDVPQFDGPVVAFCGIARPQQFFAGLESSGLDRGGLRLAARFAFPDHHRYTSGDLERVISAAQKAGASALLTTQKDVARLGALAESLPASVPLLTSIPLRAVPLRIEIEDEAAAVDWLMRTIRDTA